MEPKRIALLGSTGSIGQNTLTVARHLGIRVEALAAYRSIDLLEEQARLFAPKLIAVFDPDRAVALQKKLPHIRVVAGMEGLLEVVSLAKVTDVVSAMSGTVGILPTARALEEGKRVLLANKEALVSAGECLMDLAFKKGVEIIPIDSEHSALFQCLKGEERKEVHRLVLTASGGPFRTYSAERLSQITVEEALAHPTWAMGPKVTIDCSTLMNKGIEVIEAHYLFGIPVEKIDVLVHPQSVVHGMVQFVDGSSLAQLSDPHMIYPIQYALTHPGRMPGPLKHLDLAAYGSLAFTPPDLERFPCLRLAKEAIQKGGSLPCFMNGANDVLVHRFLSKEISWNQIGKKLEKLMEKHIICKEMDLERVLEIDAQARRQALKE